MRAALALAVLLAAPALAFPAASLDPRLIVPGLGLQPVATGLDRPLLFTHAGDGTDRWFVAEQRGIVHVFNDGVRDPVPYLDIRTRVICCGERGLLGLAFAPDFETSGRLYISYTAAGNGTSVLERLVVAQPATGRPPGSGEVLLWQPQPFSNHNGGNIVFGPDGYLYFGLGDGGSAGDPQNNGQRLDTLLGKMLRLDVSGPGGYAIPPSNPFAGREVPRPEIWAMGLRNPWRFSFDRVLGDLWIADVGQNLWEEVNLQPAASLGAENYGWRWWEGNHPYVVGGPSDGMTFPVLEYNHGLGCSITGGYVYRGLALPTLQGHYLYGDYCTGRIWHAFRVPGSLLPFETGLPDMWQNAELLDTNLAIASFGEDEAGEVYVVHLASGSGAVYRLRGL